MTRFKRLAVLAVTALAGTATPIVLMTPSEAYAATESLYASAGGTGTTCTDSAPCSLSQALATAVGGDTIYLVSPSSSPYVGNWDVDTSDTTPASPLTIEPLAGVSDPTLDGNDGSATNCSTSACNGPILSLGGGVSLTVMGLTFENADNTSTDRGGAIDTGDSVIGGTLTISDSTFSSNTAGHGGAIDSGDFGGGGSVDISDSTFTGNTAPGGSFSDGGAIDSGDYEGGGSVSISNSTFTGNSATDGGAIDSGDNGFFGSGGSVSISDATFSGNSAYAGPAIDSGRNGFDEGGSVSVAGDLFADDCEQDGGTWNDNGYNAGVDTSCFSSGTGDVASSSVSGDLGSLRDNGGPTETMAVAPSDSAFELVPSSVCTTLNTADQRGLTRPGVPGESCDAGAFEYQAPKFTSGASTTFTVAEAGSFEVSTSSGDGGVPSLNETGSLPDGVTFTDNGNGTGTLSGTPTTNSSGVYPFTITATDANEITTTQDVTLIVGQADQAIIFTSTAPTHAVVGGTSYTVSATGGASGNPVTFGSNSPSVCTVSGSAVRFIGPGTCVVDATQAGNGGYLTASQAFQSFTVYQDPPDPTLTVPGATTVHTGEPWAGSRPLEIVVGGIGFGLIGCGELRRRRCRRSRYGS